MRGEIPIGKGIGSVIDLNRQAIIEIEKALATGAFPPRSKAVRLQQQKEALAAWPNSPEHKRMQEQILESLREEHRQDQELFKELGIE